MSDNFLELLTIKKFYEEECTLIGSATTQNLASRLPCGLIILCHYFARYIEVKTPDLAKKIIEAMHRSDIRGRQIIVREVCCLSFCFIFALCIPHF